MSLLTDRYGDLVPAADAEALARAAHDRGRREVLAGLRALADLNGSLGRVVKAFDEGGPDRVTKAAAWDPDDHPRDDHGRFVSADELEAAKADPAKADELRAKVSRPKQRAKLEAILAGEPPKGGAGGGVLALPDAEFAAAVRAAADAQTHGQPRKAWVADVYDTLKAHDPTLDEAAFKRRLHETPAVRQLLTRSDLVHLEDPGLAERSAVDYHGFTAHFVGAAERDRADASDRERDARRSGRRPDPVRLPADALPAAAAPEPPPPAKPAPKKPAKPPTVDDTHAFAKKMAGVDAPKDAVKRLAERFQQHTHAELDELKKRVGIRASGPKAELAWKLAERYVTGDKTNLSQRSAERVTVDDAHARIKEHDAAGRLNDPATVKEVARMLGRQMSVRDLAVLMKRLGVRASGPKWELAKKIAERAGKVRADLPDREAVAAQAPEPERASPPVAAARRLRPGADLPDDWAPHELTAGDYAAHLATMREQHNVDPKKGVRSEVLPGDTVHVPSRGGKPWVARLGGADKKYGREREFLRGKESRSGMRKQVVTHAFTPTEPGEYEVAGDEFGKYRHTFTVGDPAAMHRAEVAAAVKAGTPVHPEVLADYPDLAGQQRGATGDAGRGDGGPVAGVATGGRERGVAAGRDAGAAVPDSAGGGRGPGRLGGGAGTGGEDLTRGRGTTAADVSPAPATPPAPQPGETAHPHPAVAGVRAEHAAAAGTEAHAYLDNALHNANAHPDDDATADPTAPDAAEVGLRVARGVARSYLEARRLGASPDTLAALGRAMGHAKVREAPDGKLLHDSPRGEVQLYAAPGTVGDANRAGGTTRPAPDLGGHHARLDRAGVKPGVWLDRAAVSRALDDNPLSPGDNTEGQRRLAELHAAGHVEMARDGGTWKVLRTAAGAGAATGVESPAAPAQNAPTPPGNTPMTADTPESARAAVGAGRMPFPVETKPAFHKLLDRLKPEDLPEQDYEAPVASLVATQTNMSATKVGAMLAGTLPDTVEGGTPVVVVRTPDGKEYIAEGHHRAAAAAVRGDKTLRAKLLLYDGHRLTPAAKPAPDLGGHHARLDRAGVKPGVWLDRAAGHVELAKDGATWKVLRTAAGPGAATGVGSPAAPAQNAPTPLGDTPMTADTPPTSPPPPTPPVAGLHDGHRRIPGTRLDMSLPTHPGTVERRGGKVVASLPHYGSTVAGKQGNYAPGHVVEVGGVPHLVTSATAVSKVRDEDHGHVDNRQDLTARPLTPPERSMYDALLAGRLVGARPAHETPLAEWLAEPHPPAVPDRVVLRKVDPKKFGGQSHVAAVYAGGTFVEPPTGGKTVAEVEQLARAWFAKNRAPAAMHRAAVRAALADKKTVPPEVLADYPDLAPAGSRVG